MNMSHADDNRDPTIVWLTICVGLLTVNAILTAYQIERLTDAIKDRRNDEQTVEPISAYSKGR